MAMCTYEVHLTPVSECLCANMRAHVVDMQSSAQRTAYVSSSNIGWQ